MTTQEIHDELQKNGIQHFCHYKIRGGDLGSAMRVCTECRIQRGVMSLQDVLSGKIDASSTAIAFEQDVRHSSMGGPSVPGMGQ